MFARTRTKDDKLQPVIDSLLTDMVKAETDTKEYANMVNHLGALYKIREMNNPKSVSRDTVLVVAGNLLGIVLILGYEKAGVVTSRAIGFVLKSQR